MADLIIRGLNLPKSLGGEETHIDIRIFSDGTVIMATSRPPYYKKFYAVPLPEWHGRLIDADALANSDAVKMKGCAYQEEIFAAPTIVPAEGGNADGN